MSILETPAVDPGWLRLREDADAAARATALLDPLLAALPAAREAPLVIWDLGCGTGSMLRWLAPRLPGPQHWILYDQDALLLEHAAAALPPAAADGATVTVQIRQGDLSTVGPEELRAENTGLVCTSALLDVLTSTEVNQLIATLTAACCPALFALSVDESAQLCPAEPLDEDIAAAFAGHQQRRLVHRGHLLGSAAPQATAAAFHRHGAKVWRAASPWHLGSQQPELLRQWLTGWVEAAYAWRPELRTHSADSADSADSVDSADYLARRLASCSAGALRAVVPHTDLLAVPSRFGVVAP